MNSEKFYYHWLTNKIDLSKYNYSRLIARLWDKEFYSLIPHDEDRGKDGLAYRNQWSEITGLKSDFGPPTVLEVIIALSERINTQLWGGAYADSFNIRDIFWKLIENLDLLNYDDSVGGISGPINDILNIWLDRKYEKDGTGGLFVVKNTDKNFRKLNLWDQMQIYIRKEWPI